MSDFFPYYSVFVHMRDIYKNARQVPVPQTMLLNVHLPFNNNNHTLYSFKTQFKNNMKGKLKHHIHIIVAQIDQLQFFFFSFFYIVLLIPALESEVCLRTKKKQQK